MRLRIETSVSKMFEERKRCLDKLWSQGFRGANGALATDLSSTIAALVLQVDEGFSLVELGELCAHQ
ncbi:hypothetical protein LPU83_pLPU83d_1101 (plasmid) [Rhizobium favelukesii]|uniref:Uncharacterized protein n=1 Tax=Rhizobium favelukesii TaxID=348824 RepID=W6S8N0_9HYPH|nr:hypothetical protein LPU83_pLPU83d_1101 [Rhizobium favelukesii]